LSFGGALSSFRRFSTSRRTSLQACLARKLRMRSTLKAASVKPSSTSHAIKCAVMPGQRCLRPARGGLRLLPRERPVFAPASETPIWPAGRKSTRAYPIATALATPILYPARDRRQ